MAENVVLSSMLMDRGEPLGNSLDKFTRRALHTIVGNDAANPIPVYLSDSAGSGLFLINSDVSDPGVDQTLITYTVPSEMYLASAAVKFSNYGKFFVKLNGNLLASGRVGPAKSDDVFIWTVQKRVSAGDVLELIFRAAAETPIDEVEAYIIASQP